jgi:hypothetical protein
MVIDVLREFESDVPGIRQLQRLATQDRLNPAVHLELPEYPLHVVLDRQCAEFKDHSDLVVAFAIRDPVQHFNFAGRQ